MRRIAFLAGVLALSGCQPAAAPPEETAATEPMSDEDTLRARTEEYEVAYGKGDGQAIGSLFTEDGDYVAVDGGMTHGRAAIGELWQNRFSSDRKGSRASIDVTGIRFLRPDVAIVDGTFAVEMKSAEGADLPAMNGMYTNVWVKQNGQWMIHCLRPMIPLKAQGT
jgi:uncharacterized protein (TIGR02246 family)